MSTAIKNTADDFTRYCQTIARHCGDVMNDPAPTTFSVGLGTDPKGPVYRITIETSRFTDKPDPAYPTTRHRDGKTRNIWDQVWIAIEGDEGKGTCCGNRCGGRDTLAGLYADELRKA